MSILNSKNFHPDYVKYLESRRTSFDADIQECAQLGATLLDKHIPDWFRKINLSNLHMSSCYMCILGQLFGEYVQGLHTIESWSEFSDENGRTSDKAIDFGFEVDRGTHYNHLNDAWAFEIHERLQQDAAKKEESEADTPTSTAVGYETSLFTFETADGVDPGVAFHVREDAIRYAIEHSLKVIENRFEFLDSYEYLDFTSKKGLSSREHCE